jgi:choline dehydrogenase-like flavoprotein
MRTAEPNGPLEIQPNFLAEQADVDALAVGVELGLGLAAQPAYRDLIGRWVAPPKRLRREETVAFIRRSWQSHMHPVGTCAMGSGREAVVDAELRVRGVEGPRIADASVMPTIPSGPTNAPTVIIGEFASRLLAATWAADSAGAMRSQRAARETREETPIASAIRIPTLAPLPVYGDAAGIADFDPYRRAPNDARSVEHRFDLALRRGLEPPGTNPAGIVDQDVEASECIERLPQGERPTFLRADVRGDPGDRSTSLA